MSKLKLTVDIKRSVAALLPQLEAHDVVVPQLRNALVMTYDSISWLGNPSFKPKNADIDDLISHSKELFTSMRDSDFKINAPEISTRDRETHVKNALSKIILSEAIKTTDYEFGQEAYLYKKIGNFMDIDEIDCWKDAPEESPKLERQKDFKSREEQRERSRSKSFSSMSKYSG